MFVSGLILGLLGSLHCIGMCGPIAFMLPVDRSNSLKKFGQVSLYHFGRLMAYAFIGGIFGLLGKSLYIFGIQQQLSIAIGALMIILILIPANQLSRFTLSRPVYKLISKVKSSLGQAFKKRTADTFLTIGFLNGFLPCGLVYMAVLGSIATGKATAGALYMILFGLGTVPMMTAAVYLGKFLNTKLRSRITKAIPVVVVVIGVLFILRGLGLGIPYISPAPVTEMATNAIECH